MIIVIHRKDELYYSELGYKIFRIDRQYNSLLGSPFVLYKETGRDIVCDQYEEYFYNTVLKNQNAVALLDFYKKESLTSNIALSCWCAPKRCHGDTIKKYLDNVGVI